MQYAYIDFEYNQTSHPRLNLVSCALKIEDGTYSYWLHNNPDDFNLLREKLLSLRDSHVFVSYAVTAEARSFISLRLDPRKFKWIDLQSEWKMLLNHNHELQYGDVLVSGKPKRTKAPPPKYWRTEEDVKEQKEGKFAQADKSLAGMTYGLLGVLIDTAHKDKMRDLIISNPPEFTEEERKAILLYGESDVKYLHQLLSKTISVYKTLMPPELLQRDKLVADLFNRGDYAARSAIMEAVGYPVKKEWVLKFCAATKDILDEIRADIAEQFPEIKPFKRIKDEWVWNQKATREWVASQNFEHWMLTEKKALSLALEAFEMHFNFSHDYPRGNFGAQMVRYLKTKQALNGFVPPKDKKKKTFLDFLGPDSFVRTYFGIYGSQSSRSQPTATGFIPLKSAWMRSLIMPPPGYAIVGIDYSSQEFLISALLSKDQNMINAYKSGDVYFYFAKLAGAVPWDAKKEDHKATRDLFKATTLGISYDMGAKGLAKKLTADMGYAVTEIQAQELIHKFEKAYPKFIEFKNAFKDDYYSDRVAFLKDGWCMFGDNVNNKSVGNMPIQGAGAAIMRRAVQLAQDSGVQVIYTLHDALYVMYPSNDFSHIDRLNDAMAQAFYEYFGIDEAREIRMEAGAWSDDYEESEITTPKGLKVSLQKMFIDERSVNELKKFAKYFLTEEERKKYLGDK